MSGDHISELDFILTRNSRTKHMLYLMLQKLVTPKKKEGKIGAKLMHILLE